MPSQKQLSSSAPPGCHRACLSVVLVLAICPASEHHVIGSAVVDFLAVMMSVLHGHMSSSPTFNLLYMWALSLLCPVFSLNRVTCSGVGIMEANDCQVTTVFTVQPVIPPSALNKRSTMKHHHHRQTCSHTSPRHLPTVKTVIT